MQPSSFRDPKSAKPETYFAPAGRAPLAAVRAAATRIAEDAVVGQLLQNYGGLLVLLNEQRQILAVNHQLLGLLGVDDADQVLGLRPGEAIDCVHAADHAGGCGTSRFCSTCGAAIAIVLCQEAGAPADRECVLDCHIGGQATTLDLNVHTSRIDLAGQGYVLLFLQDVTADKRRAAVERAFFHDINNLLACLLGTVVVQAAASGSLQDESVNQVRSMVLRIAKELEVQRALSSANPVGYPVQLVDCEVGATVDQLRQQLVDHPAARDKRIDVRPIARGLSVRTDQHLLIRVLTNMVINALEATPRGGEVTIEASAQDSQRLFTVWNAGHIPDRVAMRIFQRYFSTKDGLGRGVGTYSMKLFAEEYLGGTVAFSTHQSEGTRFSLRLPSEPEAADG